MKFFQRGKEYKFIDDRARDQFVNQGRGDADRKIADKINNNSFTVISDGGTIGTVRGFNLNDEDIWASDYGQFFFFDETEAKFFCRVGPDATTDRIADLEAELEELEDRKFAIQLELNKLYKGGE